MGIIRVNMYKSAGYTRNVSFTKNTLMFFEHKKIIYSWNIYHLTFYKKYYLKYKILKAYVTIGFKSYISKNCKF